MVLQLVDDEILVGYDEIIHIETSYIERCGSMLNRINTRYIKFSHTIKQWHHLLRCLLEMVGKAVVSERLQVIFKAKFFGDRICPIKLCIG